MYLSSYIKQRKLNTGVPLCIDPRQIPSDTRLWSYLKEGDVVRKSALHWCVWHWWHKKRKKVSFADDLRIATWVIHLLPMELKKWAIGVWIALKLVRLLHALKSLSKVYCQISSSALAVMHWMDWHRRNITHTSPSILFMLLKRKIAMYYQVPSECAFFLRPVVRVLLDS